ncbi:MAG TPA: hypothetical protein PLQ56_18645 [Aggregatilineales bacterium]|nr:hypothetical protein [Aggregatilineales bacterium]
MIGTIWLITEDESDYQVVVHTLKVKGFTIQVKWLKLEGKSGGISRLAAQIELQIGLALERKGPTDCVLVLHDQDETEPDRTHYDSITTACKDQPVYHLVAKDEIEAWLLADKGLADWLNIKHQNWDSQAKPSKELERLIRKQYPRMHYRGADRAKVLAQITGENRSAVLEKAIAYLRTAPCAR